jgi:hypothetical protein
MKKAIVHFRIVTQDDEVLVTADCLVTAETAVELVEKLRHLQRELGLLGELTWEEKQ